MKSILSRCPDLNVTHVSYLGFVGRDRPESVGQSHRRSPEIRQYLKDRGLTVDEFDEMRFPAKELFPSQVKEAASVSQNQSGPKTEEEMAKHLAGKLIRTKSLKDRKLKTMLRTPDEVEIASHLIKMLQECVSQSDQKLTGESQRHKEESTSTVQNSKQNEDNWTSQQDFPQFLTEVRSVNETKESRIAVTAKGFSKNYENVGESKAADNDDVPHMRRVLSNETGGFVLESKVGKLSPLQYLRHFIKNNFEITIEGDIIWFGEAGFPKLTRTNFQVSIQLKIMRTGIMFLL